MALKDSDEETLGHSNENRSVRGGGEKGEREPQERGPVGFWHKDLQHARSEVFKKMGITSEQFKSRASADKGE
jgi:hypothetical protein